MKLVQDMSMALVMKPAITMLEIFLPEYVIDEINNYLDEKRKILPSFAKELVGQIKAHDDSIRANFAVTKEEKKYLNPLGLIGKNSPMGSLRFRPRI